MSKHGARIARLRELAAEMQERAQRARALTRAAAGVLPDAQRREDRLALGGFAGVLFGGPDADAGGMLLAHLAYGMGAPFAREARERLDRDAVDRWENEGGATS